MSIAIPILLLSRRQDVAYALEGDPGVIRYALGIAAPEAFELAGIGRYSAVILDLPSLDDGLALGRKLRQLHPSLEMLAIVGEERNGVDALRSGAFDFLAWPPREPAELWMLVGALIEKVGPPRRGATGTVAGYNLLRHLGAGGMADVFLAQRPGGEALVLKCMRPDIAEETQYVEMFLEEARISRALLHPNIVRVHDAGGSASELYIAMEYVPGKNLAEIGKAAGWRFPPEIACWIAAEVAAALDYAHRCTDADGKLVSLIHRDVNPPNVLIREDGAVKLADFGIAKTAQHHSRTTQGVLRGKVEYLSPEQVEGLPLDARTDVFSLGALLYLLLTGVHPFQATTTMQTLQRIRAARCDEPSIAAPGVPAKLDPIVLRALARDRAERYPTAAALERDLRAWLASAGEVGRERVAEFVGDATDGGTGVVPQAHSPGKTVRHPEMVTVLSPPRLDPAGEPEGSTSPWETSDPTESTAPSATPRMTRLTPAVAVSPPAASRVPRTEDARPVAMQEDTVSRELEVSRETTAEVTVAVGVDRAPPPRAAAVRVSPVRTTPPRDLTSLWVGAAGAAVALVFFAWIGWGPAKPADTVTIAIPTPFATATPRAVSTVAAPRTTATTTSMSTPTPTPPPTTPAAVPSPGPVKTAKPRLAAVATPRPAPLRKGTVSIWVAEGWAAVSVDGRSLGINAPIVGLELTEGRHRITLENGPLKLRRDYDVTVKAGEDFRLNASLR